MSSARRLEGAGVDLGSEQRVNGEDQRLQRERGHHHLTEVRIDRLRKGNARRRRQSVGRMAAEAAMQSCGILARADWSREREQCQLASAAQLLWLGTVLGQQSGGGGGGGPEG